MGTSSWLWRPAAPMPSGSTATDHDSLPKVPTLPSMKKRRSSVRELHDLLESESVPGRCLFPTLPLELLAEILIQANSPRDVLSVARTSKLLCSTLVCNPAADFIWRTIRKNCLPHALPDPTPNFSEAAYAAFVYDGGSCDVNKNRFPWAEIMWTDGDGIWLCRCVRKTQKSFMRALLHEFVYVVMWVTIFQLAMCAEHDCCITTVALQEEHQVGDDSTERIYLIINYLVAANILWMLPLFSKVMHVMRYGFPTWSPPIALVTRFRFRSSSYSIITFQIQTSTKHVWFFRTFLESVVA